MSNAALCATSTVSSQNWCNAGSTLSIVGCPASIASSMPVIAAALGDIARLGSTSCSKTSCSSRRPLTMRTAPIETISSPSDGDRPVVSVSKTV